VNGGAGPKVARAIVFGNLFSRKPHDKAPTARAGGSIHVNAATVCYFY
jgi:hypothetical protein